MCYLLSLQKFFKSGHISSCILSIRIRLPSSGLIYVHIRLQFWYLSMESGNSPLILSLQNFLIRPYILWFIIFKNQATVLWPYIRTYQATILWYLSMEIRQLSSDLVCYVLFCIITKKIFKIRPYILWFFIYKNQATVLWPYIRIYQATILWYFYFSYLKFPILLRRNLS